MAALSSTDIFMCRLRRDDCVRLWMDDGANFPCLVVYLRTDLAKDSDDLFIHLSSRTSMSSSDHCYDAHYTRISTTLYPGPLYPGGECPVCLDYIPTLSW